MRRVSLWRRIRAATSTAAAAAALALGLTLAGPGVASAQYDFKPLEKTLTDSTFKEGAIYISHKGVVAEKFAWGSWASRTDAQLNQPMAVYSVSKTYAAVVAMSVMADPNVGMTLDDPVKKWIPDVTTLNTQTFHGVKAYDVMTIRQLMNMTNGMAYYGELNSCLNSLFYTFSSCTTKLIKDNLTYEPGTTFNYSGGDWQVLGQVLVNAVNAAYGTNLTFTGVVNKYLLTPCGFTQTQITRSYNEWVAGGFKLGLLDGGRFAQALLSRTCGGTTLLSATQRQQMEANQIAGLAIGSSDPSTDDRTYGLGLWRNDQTGSPDTGVYLGIGAYGSIVFYNPARNYSGFLLVSKANGAVDATNLMEQLIPLINAQVDANP